MAKKSLVSMKINDVELKKLLVRFAQMQPKIQNKYTRAGVTKGARVVAKVAKNIVATETGTLKRSIGQRVYKQRGDIVGIAGPRRGFKTDKAGILQVGFARGTTRITSGRRKGKFTSSKKKVAADKQARWRNPTRYAHLVEFGTKHTPARPFLRPAWDASRGVVLGLIAAELRVAVKVFNTGNIR